MKKVFKALACALSLAFTVAFAHAQDKPSIVTVNYPLQYFTERLVGDAADVVFPVPTDVDPSFWRPTIGDVSTIQSADLILLNGAGFATWIDRVSLPRSRLVDTSDGYADRLIATQSITHSHGDGGEHSHDAIATYTWLDPQLALAQAQAVATAIVDRGLVSDDAVAKRLASLRADLETLDADNRAALAGAENIVFVATHPRYQYFARAYGLTILSLEWEAGAMPEAEDLDQLLRLVADQGASVLIWEAAPPDGAIAATDALGLQSVIFPPLAQRPESGTFGETFRASVNALAAVTVGN